MCKEHTALQLSFELVREVGSIIEKLPLEEVHIKDQLGRAVTSIPLNIAKAEQLYPKFKVSHYSIAIGSLNEVESLLNDTKTMGIISEFEYDVLLSLIQKIINFLEKILSNLSKQYPDIIVTGIKSNNAHKNSVRQKTTRLLSELLEFESKDYDEWTLHIINILKKSISNIASHFSEANQLYRGNEMKSLNHALQEVNVTKAFFEIIKVRLVDEEKHYELKNLVLEIQSEILRRMRLIDQNIQ